MKDDQELVTVTATVPRDRLGDLYHHVARLNEGGTPSSSPAAISSEGQPWSPDDTDLAARLYGMVSENARRILDELMELGDAGSISGTELASRAGIDKGPYGVAGSLSSVGKATAKVGRALPYRVAPNEAGGPGVYGMEDTVAELFRVARTAKEERS